MKVRAKFECTKAEKQPVGNGNEVVYNYEFLAVTSGSPENDEFFKWTPSGDMRINSVVNDQFEEGKEYYIDFVPVE